jgi:hypothetical protein
METNYMFFEALKLIKDKVDAMLALDKTKVDELLTNGHNWAVEHVITAKDDIEEVGNFLLQSEELTDEELMEAERCMEILCAREGSPLYEVDETYYTINEAEYQGRNVKLGKIMRGDVKKFKVYVKNDKGKVVKVNFGHGGTSAKSKGEKTMRIKKNIPGRRKAFRSRFNCDSPGPRWKPRYWACRTW